MSLSDAEQAEALSLIRNLHRQLFTGPDPNTPGWPAFPGGTPGVHTVVDYLRNNDVLQHAIWNEIESAIHNNAPTTTATTATTPGNQLGGLDQATLSNIIEQAVLSALSQVKFTPNTPTTT